MSVHKDDLYSKKPVPFSVFTVYCQKIKGINNAENIVVKYLPDMYKDMGVQSLAP